jgi:electron transfer flavoprotein beta subunit
VNEIHPEVNSLVVKQLSDGFMNTLKIRMPALLTVAADLAMPHHVPFGDLERAFSRGEVIRWGLEDLGLRKEEVGLMGSATRVWQLYAPPPKRRGEVLSGTAPELVEHLISKLEALSILDEDEPK